VGAVIAVLAAAGLLLLARPVADASPTPPASPPAASTTSGSVTVFGSPYTLRAGDVIDGNVDVYGGDAGIEGTVTHDVRVFAGSAEIDGPVGHDVVVLGGSVHLGPHATVAHDLTVLGGTISRDPGSQVGHRVTQQGRSAAGGVTSRIPLPTTRLPLLPGGDLGLGVGLGIGVLLLALLLQLFFPAHVAMTRDALEDRPYASLGLGVLTVLAGALMAVLLAITVVLLPASVAIGVAMGVGWLLGLAGAMLLIGQRLAAALHLHAEPVPALLLGGALVVVLANVPVLGDLFAVVAGSMALGAVVMTRFGTRPHPRPEPALSTEQGGRS
jgi:hypothetical protein